MTDDLVASGYDAVYAALGDGSPTFQRLWSEHACGRDFPAGYDHISFVTLQEITALSAGLRLAPGGKLVDLACGMGGPGLWVARTNQARLTGIDVSPVGVEQARRRAARLGVGGHAASFAVGTFSGTGLSTGTVDAVMTVDALQYAPDKRAALAEMARLLRPGGRLAITVFEVDPGKVGGLPVLGDDPVADYRGLLDEAGFAVETYEETPGWRERMAAAYGAVLAHMDQLNREVGQAAANALTFEMAMTLDLDPYPRRVLVVATSGK